MKRAKALDEEGRELRRSSVRYPVAANMLWDPQPEHVETPEYDSDPVVGARLTLWEASKSAHNGRPSAAETHYRSRQPEDTPADPA